MSLMITRKISYFFVLVMVFSLETNGQFHPAAGQPGSSAISNDSSIFVGWATGCEVVRGFIDASQTGLGKVWFGDASEALGKAEGNSVKVVSLGDGGIATLFFENPITDGEGWDFAVFENALNDSFLELAFVEVSSDGTNFFRFPAVSMTSIDEQVATFGAIDATKINNLAGKYRQGYGTPFDLAELSGTVGLDISRISYVRIVDVVGCIQDNYATYDDQGHKVNDPWPTPFETGGFDLDGVGIIHSSEAMIAEQNQSFSIFPNPFIDHFKVSSKSIFNDGFDVEILNSKGLVIYRNNTQTDATVDLNGFPEGLYFIKIKSQNQVFVDKVLKIK